MVGKDIWFILGMSAGMVVMLVWLTNGEPMSKYDEYREMLKECEQVLLQENAPRGKVCAITTTVVDMSEINKQGEKK